MLFSRAAAPRLFALPPGVDFPAAVIAGLLARLDGQPPEALARVTLYVNTARMQRRLRAIFDAGPPRLPPRIRLLTDLAAYAGAGLPPAATPLRRRLDLARLTAGLIRAEPDLAPQSAAFGLADSLAALLDEMEGEGVGLAALERLDTDALAAHWQRSLRFLRLIGQCLPEDPSGPADPEGRQRRAVQLLAERWRASPPADPILVAGSTGSRGTTRLFLEAVASLPQGAVILPGVDPDLPASVWSRLCAPVPLEDHPQYRHAALAAALGRDPAALPRWTDVAPPDPARNRLLSLALRPAPVTDGWLREGAALGDLRAATARLSLIEAPDPRAEANAIALVLRGAAEAGRRAALVSPDRVLTRRVTLALQRWDILPDDSAGTPLRQTAAGRLLLQIAGLLGEPAGGAELIGLLKHPMARGGLDRGAHLRLVRELELALRRFGPPQPGAADLANWASTCRDPAAAAWAARIGIVVEALTGMDCTPTLAALTGTMTTAAAALLAGPEDLQAGSNPGWPGEDGAAVQSLLDILGAEATEADSMAPAAFRTLLRTMLSGGLREPLLTHPHIMIWGTLEARVQDAELVILGGLNDGVWPELPGPDPWLNRRMRRQAGLLSPERRIGLAALDFQQAAAAPEVVLSRALRGAETASIPSRWLNRLTSLVQGLPAQGGAEALAAMRGRGARWVQLAARLDRPARPVAKAWRPAPRPPAAARPTRLSVTEVETLIRDPYAVYARRILRLSPLEPLYRGAEPRDRGIALHEMLERFVAELDGLSEDAWPDTLRRVARDTLERTVPWPTARRLRLARLERAMPAFLAGELQRRALARPHGMECRGRLELREPEFTLTAKADRIDRMPDGRLWVYDYKTGAPPSAAQQKAFNKQLLLEAVIAEAGGFEGVPAAPVAGAAYIGLGPAGRTVEAPLAEMPPARIRKELAALLARYADPATGYTAQPAQHSDRHRGDYDQLSRKGEWPASAPSRPEEVGR